MYYLSGEASILTERLEKLQLNPPRDWSKYIPDDEKFTEGYYWFRYSGDMYPHCYLYVCLKNQSGNRYSYMILPDNDNDRTTLEENFEKITLNLFAPILDEKLVMEEEA